jgi:hypothetical protein
MNALTATFASLSALTTPFLWAKSYTLLTLTHALNVLGTMKNPSARWFARLIVLKFTLNLKSQKKHL